MAPSSTQPAFIIDGLIGPERNLPVILCLHGGGTNTTIFNVQTVRLQRALSEHFRFIFIDGPHVAEAGPGVMPFFEGCDPFYRWMKTLDDKHLISIPTRSLIEETIKGVSGEIVGVLGFSQGSRLAAGLMWEQQFTDVKIADGFKFKFGVLFAGISSPMTEHLGDGKGEQKTISIPTLHVVGIEDQWADDSRELYDVYFDKTTSVIYEFDIGHHLPVAEDQTTKVAAEILKMYNATK